MKAGFTGSRKGTNSGQLHVLRSWLQENLPEEFHHGCCVGADTYAHYEAQRLVETIVFHPPTDMSQATDFREFPGVWRKPKDYLSRNRAIVDETDLLIAMPNSKVISFNQKGGTFYTVRYALSISKPVLVIWPDQKIGKF